MKILIVKTSSMGDIIQAFPILPFLHHQFPHVEIDWAVEEAHTSIVAAHPLVKRTFPVDIKGLRKNWRPHSWRHLWGQLRCLRSQKYDLIFDFQGNCKSGIVTLLARGALKVGFGWKSVREWPNALTTHIRFDPPSHLNIRLQYLHLLQSLIEKNSLRGAKVLPLPLDGVRFRIDTDEQKKLNTLLSRPRFNTPYKIMVCPGSKWGNKQMVVETLIEFLRRIQQIWDASFLLIWGNEEEKAYCLKIRAAFSQTSDLIDRLPLPTWQNLIGAVDLVIAVDSSALHLCGTTSTPSFSIFGPTQAEVFKPIGQRHFAYQGKCPYGRTFAKTCPILRSCPTGACIHSLSADEIHAAFFTWWQSLHTRP